MLGQVQFEEIHTESECSQSDEDEESYNTSILDVFKEIEIRGDGHCLFRALSLGAFGYQEYHLTVREMAWDYIDTNRNRFKKIIDQEMDSYIVNMRKSRTWGGHIEIIGFAELFETNIFIYDLVIDLEPRHKMEYSNSFNTVRLMYRNNDHYNLLTKKNTELKDIGVPKMTKLMIKLMAKNKKAWTITENHKDNDFVNEEEIVPEEKKTRL